MWLLHPWMETARAKAATEAKWFARICVSRLMSIHLECARILAELGDIAEDRAVPAFSPSYNAHQNGRAISLINKHWRPAIPLLGE